MLVLVQRERLLPSEPGLPASSELLVRLGEMVQRVRLVVGVAQLLAQRPGLPVAVHRLLMLAGVVGDVAEAVQRGRLAVAVIVAAEQLQRLRAMRASLLV